MLLDCLIEILHIAGYSDTSCVFICYIAKHCRATFRKLLAPRRLTFNLTCTIFYSGYGTHVVIYIPVFAH